MFRLSSKKYASLFTCWLKNLTNTEECTKEISKSIIENGINVDMTFIPLELIILTICYRNLTSCNISKHNIES